MTTKRLYVELSDDRRCFLCQPFGKSRFSDTWIFERPKWLSLLPDFKPDKDGTIQVGVTDLTCTAFEAFEQAGNILEMQDDAREAMHFCSILRAGGDKVAAINTKFKAGEVDQVPGVDYGVLNKYQCAALNCSLYLPGFAYFMKQGTGKSATAIMALMNDAKNATVENPYRGIIVCPPNVRYNWLTELEKFSTKEYAATVLRGTQLTRLTQLLTVLQMPKPIQLVICNYETLSGSHDALSRVPFDIGILDEAHYFKSRTTKRWKYVSKLREQCAKRLVLTGSPISNSIMDLYTLLEFLGPGSSGFATWEGFKSHYGVFDKTEHGDVFVAAQNVPELQQRLARCSFIISKKEALPFLPEKTHSIIEVSMESDQAAAYEKLRDDLIIEIDAKLAGGEVNAVVVQNVLVQLLRLSQITSSFSVIPKIVDENGNELSPRIVQPFATNVKVNAAVEEALQLPPDEKCIIWSNWIEDILAMEAALKAVGKRCVTFYGDTSIDDRREAERAFNFDRDCQFFIGNPAAGGTGLNLIGHPPDAKLSLDYDTDCCHVWYLSKNWSPIQLEQSTDRAHRIGTRRPIAVKDFIVPGTIDTVIHKKVETKLSNQSDLLNITEILSDIRGQLCLA